MQETTDSKLSRLTPIGRFFAIAVAALLVSVPSAGASTAQGEQQGSRTLQELDGARARRMAMTGEGMTDGLGQDGIHGSRTGDGQVSGSSSDNGADGPSAGAMVGVMAVLIATVAIAAFLLGRRRPPSALDTLGRRYADGELGTEEYEEARRLLGGSRG